MENEKQTETEAKRQALKAAITGKKVPRTPAPGMRFLSPENGNYEEISIEEYNALKKWAKKRQ